jgi:hypothetical protein
MNGKNFTKLKLISDEAEYIAPHYTARLFVPWRKTFSRSLLSMAHNIFYDFPIHFMHAGAFSAKASLGAPFSFREKVWELRMWRWEKLKGEGKKSRERGKAGGNQPGLIFSRNFSLRTRLRSC